MQEIQRKAWPWILFKALWQAELGKNVVLEKKLESLSQHFEETLGACNV